MNRSLACSLAALVALTGAAPALANSVYVPLAVNVEYEGVMYQTQLWVTNRADSGRKVTSYFIDTDRDGTDRPDEFGIDTQAPGGTTLFVQTVTGANSTGMLELTGVPAFLVKAELASFIDGAKVAFVEVPVLTPSNTLAAGNTAHLLPWERSGSLRTDFAIVNLGHESAQCTVDLLGPDGESLIPTALITVPPLSQRGFVDVLGSIGMPSLTASRSSVSCDQSFYAFLLQRNVESGALQFIGPAGDIGSGFADPTAPSECDPAAAKCFKLDGVFHTPTPKNPVYRADFPVPAGSYRQLRTQLDFRHGGWFAGKPNGLHNIIWLVRDTRNRDMFAYLNFWGPNNNRALFRHGFGQAQGDKAKLTAHAPLTPGQTYHVDIIYDTAQKFIEAVVTHSSSGAEVVRFLTKPDINSITFNGGQTLSADFGFVEGLNPNEPPTYGWNYMNLTMELFK